MSQPSSTPSDLTGIAYSLENLKSLPSPVSVSLNQEIVKLLSEQLYQSPLKAIEELVVNSFDAEAEKCHIYVPTDPSDFPIIAVFDDGIGMDEEGLADLWQIGHSNKRDFEIERRRNRQQIGKFGIGKLATYTIANRLTYISRSAGRILTVSINFNDFSSSPTGSGQLLSVPVHIIEDWNAFTQISLVAQIFDKFGFSARDLVENANHTWTLAILEDLKDKAQKIRIGTLRWVLRTAMPLRTDFGIYLNSEEIVSAKEDFEKIGEFELKDLPSKRIETLSEKTNEPWQVKDNLLVSPSFPQGVSGNVIVTKRILIDGKSDDLTRSHGFFIRVRERLVNENDPLFGVKALVHDTFSRFRADIQANDLDNGLKASRETIEESNLKTSFRVLLREVFNEADRMYKGSMEDTSTRGRKEDELITVPPRLVNQPIADALSTVFEEPLGQEADEGWFYLEIPNDADLQDLLQNLYTHERTQKYRYNYTQFGSSARLVQFDPSSATFWLNQDHELVQEYSGSGQAQILLEDFATAEALLEVYLRANDIPPHIIGNVLERRDALLRSLVKDHTYSPSVVAKTLRESASDETELEVALVVAARMLGFVATHVSGSGEPDGIARFIDYPGGEKVITLEAKSSKNTPSLNAFDFAGLHQHMEDYEADGCLLVAPSYPQVKAGQMESSVAKRGSQQKVSCWTVDQLADFVEYAESFQFNARHILDIVLKAFTPEEVTSAIKAISSDSQKDNHELYRAILQAMRQLEGRMKDRPRDTSMVATQVTANEAFKNANVQLIEYAIHTLARASQGGMRVAENGDISINVSFDELERRLSSLTRQASRPLTRSGFRTDEEA